MQPTTYPYDVQAGEDQRVPLVIILLAPFIVSAVSLGALPFVNWIVWGLGVLIAAAFVVGALQGGGAITKELVLYWVFAGWAFLGSINAVAVELFYERYFSVIQFAALIAIVSHYTVNNRVLRIVLGAEVVGVLIIGVSGYLTGDYDQVEKGRGYITGMGMNSNAFALSLALGGGILLYYLKVWRRLIGKLLALVLLLAISSLLIASGSRTGFFCFIFFLLVWLALAYATEIRQHPLAFFGGLLVVALLGLALYSGMEGTLLAKKMTTITKERSDVYREHSSTERFGFYGVGLDLLRQYPMVGVGLSNFIAHSASMKFAHSNYVEIFVDTGVPGGFLYYSVYLVLGLRLRRLRKLCAADPENLALVRLGESVLLVWLLADFASVTYYNKMIWILAAAFMGWSYRKEKELSESILCPNGFLPVTPSYPVHGYSYPQ
jgi:O-antigen ligase